VTGVSNLINKLMRWIEEKIVKVKVERMKNRKSKFAELLEDHNLADPVAKKEPDNYGLGYKPTSIKNAKKIEHIHKHFQR